MTVSEWAKQYPGILMIVVALTVLNFMALFFEFWFGVFLILAEMIGGGIALQVWLSAKRADELRRHR